MSIIIDSMIAIPVGITYNIIVHKFGEIFNNDLDFKSKYQKQILLCFGGGILALYLSYFIFGEHVKYKNRAMRFGCYFATFLLFLYSLFYNWNSMDNDIKFIVMITILLSLCFVAYNITSDSNNKSTKSTKSTKSIKSSKSDYSETLPATYISYPKTEPFDENTDLDEIIEYK
jgi:hypothetical protein